MRSATTYLLVALAGVFVYPVAAQDAKKAPPKQEKKAEAKKPAKDVLPWKKLPSFVGKLYDIRDGKITVRVTAKVTVPVRDAAQRKLNYQRQLVSYQQQLANRQRDLARRLYDIQRQRDPRQKARLILEYQRALRQRPPQPPRPPQLVEMKEVTRDIELRLSKNVIVRRSTPELEYDEKGFPIKLTPELLKKKRGPEGYPGFPAYLSSLGKEQLVQVYLAVPTGKKKQGAVNIADIVSGKAPAPDELSDANLPEAAMIVILPAVNPK